MFEVEYKPNDPQDENAVWLISYIVQRGYAGTYFEPAEPPEIEIVSILGPNGEQITPMDEEPLYEACDRHARSLGLLHQMN